MQTRRIRTLHTIIILLIIVTIISLTFAGTMGLLYVQKVEEVSQLQGERELVFTDQTVPVLSVDVENKTPDNQEPGMPNQEVPVSTEDSEAVSGSATAGEDSMKDADAATIAALMQSKEAEVEQSIKERMKALVTGEDGSPLKMLRSFFPENLIYSFENEYVFAPVLEGVNKHNLLAENFQKTEEGLMQYVENGTVTSHKGIDVSKYQGNIDWEAVKEEGIEYAFIRLGLRGYESAKLVLDEFYDANMKGANSAGVGAGVYFLHRQLPLRRRRRKQHLSYKILPTIKCPVQLYLMWSEFLAERDAQTS